MPVSNDDRRRYELAARVPTRSRHFLFRSSPTPFVAFEICDSCGERIKIAGGIADLWTFQEETSGGLTLEFTDGSEHFLCFACIERLPDDPMAGDVPVIETDDR